MGDPRRSGRIVRWLSMGTEYGTCSASRHGFASNGKGRLVAVERREKTIGRTRVPVCGCPPNRSTGCGGARHRPLQIFYKLPRDAVYRGTVKVEYDVENASLDYRGKGVKGACPQREDPV